MKIAICDDDAQELLQISQLVEEYFGHSVSTQKTQISRFKSSMELSEKLESGKSFDMYLLDVVMPKPDGIELAAMIRNADQVAKIIFLTSSPEYAVDSYSVGAFHYLLKPVRKERLFPVLQKAVGDIDSKLKKHIVVKTQTNLLRVFLHELIYVEVIGRTLCFHQTNGELLESTSTISHIEAELLTDKRFIKPHRSFIVNLDHVKSLSPSGITTTAGQNIPVSRNVFKAVKQAYIDYSFRKKAE